MFALNHLILIDDTLNKIYQLKKYCNKSKTKWLLPLFIHAKSPLHHEEINTLNWIVVLTRTEQLIYTYTFIHTMHCALISFSSTVSIEILSHNATFALALKISTAIQTDSCSITIFSECRNFKIFKNELLTQRSFRILGTWIFSFCIKKFNTFTMTFRFRCVCILDNTLCFSNKTFKLLEQFCEQLNR